VRRRGIQDIADDPLPLSDGWEKQYPVASEEGYGVLVSLLVLTGQKVTPLSMVGILTSAEPHAQGEAGRKPVAEYLVPVDKPFFEIVVDQRLLHMNCR
jgi:hypothetical protein